MRKFTDEHKRKISEALKRHKRTPEHAAAISAAKLGVPKTHGMCAEGADKLAYQRDYRARNRARYVKYELKRRYGVSPEQYDEMLAKQGGNCKLCKRPPRNGKPLAVEHCHRTNRVRGLVHQGCNATIGGVEDVGLENVIAYLRSPEPI